MHNKSIVSKHLKKTAGQVFFSVVWEAYLLLIKNSGNIMNGILGIKALFSNYPVT